MRKFWAWLTFLPTELALEASLPVKPEVDPEVWYDFDRLMAVTIALEIGVLGAIRSFLWFHGF